MLNGKELGRAIKVAIDRKIAAGTIKSVAEVARHFSVKPPSVYGWIKTGAISKDKLPELWRYFATKTKWTCILKTQCRPRRISLSSLIDQEYD